MQDSQLVIPSEGWNDPAAHLVHVARPSVDATRPDGHGVGSTSPRRHAEPEGHSWHALAFLSFVRVEKVPSGHGVTDSTASPFLFDLCCILTPRPGNLGTDYCLGTASYFLPATTRSHCPSMTPGLGSVIRNREPQQASYEIPKIRGLASRFPVPSLLSGFGNLAPAGWPLWPLGLRVA